MTLPLPPVRPRARPSDARVAGLTLLAVGPIAAMVLLLALRAGWAGYAEYLTGQEREPGVVATSTAPAPAPLAAPLEPAQPGSRGGQPETGVPTAPGPSQPRTVLTTGSGALTVYWSSCPEALAAGVANIPAGAPGYRAALDRNGDGTACDRDEGLQPDPSSRTRAIPEPTTEPPETSASAEPVPEPTTRPVEPSETTPAVPEPAAGA